MANENEVFQAHITAKDDASKTVDEIGAKVKHLGHEFLEAGKASEHMHQMHGHAFFDMSEHLHLFRHELGGVTASLSETGSKVSELLPVFAAFGALASLEGIVENVDQTAEAFSKLHHEAVNVGVSMAMLQGLHFAAALSDTSPEALDSAMIKLNKTLGAIAIGGGKSALALFKHLHIAVRDVHGHMRSAGDLLPQLSDAFMHTSPKGPMRTTMATTLMGKGGAELIDFLSQGSAKLAAQQKDFARIGFVPTGEQSEDLENYHKAMIRVQASAQASMQAFGTAAAPALQPILDGATEFMTAHRQGVSDTIAADLKPIKAWMDGGGLERAATSIGQIAHDADSVAKSLGGWGHATELLIGLTAAKGGLFLIEPILKAGELALAIDKLVLKLGTNLVMAWGKVTTAAGEAEVAEDLALGHGPGHGPPGKAPGGKGGGSLIDEAELAVLTMLRSLRMAILTPALLSGDSDPNAGPTQWNFANHPEAASKNYRFSGDELANLPVGEDGSWYGRLFGPRPHDFPHFAYHDDNTMSGRPRIGYGGRESSVPEILDAWPSWSSPLQILADKGGVSASPFTLPDVGQVSMRGNKVEVVVSLENAPAGTTARVNSSGPDLAPGPRVNVGRAWDSLF